MTHILVTGADGFVGTHLQLRLRASGHEVRAAVRNARPAPAGRVDVRVVGNLEAGPDWEPVLEGVQSVIHLAGRAHVTRETAADPSAAFRQANVAPTLDLFRACQRAGVARLVFVSSIGVLGVRTTTHAFSEADAPHPVEPYAMSKWQAERELTALAGRGTTQLTIVRPALVCGAHARGNFDRLIGLVRRRWPLPLRSVEGRRNFVGVRNLCSLLELCATHELAGGRTYVAADPETLTTPQLLDVLATALDIRLTLLACPPALLRAVGTALGAGRELRRLTDSLLVDASLARRELGWRNDVPLSEELSEMARAAAT